MYYKRQDIEKLLGVCPNTARKYMNIVNKELQDKGIITIRGRVPKEAFNERFGING